MIFLINIHRSLLPSCAVIFSAFMYFSKIWSCAFRSRSVGGPCSFRRTLTKAKIKNSRWASFQQTVSYLRTLSWRSPAKSPWQAFKYETRMERHKLFVSGLSFDTTQDKLEELFSVHGKLRSVRLVTMRNGRSKVSFFDLFIWFKTMRWARNRSIALLEIFKVMFGCEVQQQCPPPRKFQLVAALCAAARSLISSGNLQTRKCRHWIIACSGSRKYLRWNGACFTAIDASQGDRRLAAANAKSGTDVQYVWETYQCLVTSSKVLPALFWNIEHFLRYLCSRDYLLPGP